MPFPMHNSNLARVQIYAYRRMLGGHNHGVRCGTAQSYSDTHGPSWRHGIEAVVLEEFGVPHRLAHKRLA
ncbi:hypothetical protein D3C87_2020680 [compost metagenome]